MTPILIVYSTTDGQTLKICSHLAERLKALGNAVEIRSVEEVSAADLDMAGKVIVGASIRYGHHSPRVHDFIHDHQPALEARPNALFSVNMVARKPHRNTPQTNPYLKRLLKQINWKPDHLAVFAGRVNYPIYNAFDRNLIRLIMWITKGPTDPHANIEFTDWAKVEEFAQTLHEMPGR